MRAQDVKFQNWADQIQKVYGVDPLIFPKLVLTKVGIPGERDLAENARGDAAEEKSCRRKIIGNVSHM